MVLRMRRAPKLSFPSDQLVRIVADAAVGTAQIGGSRMIPLVIFDTSGRPDLAELVRVHQHLGPGDVDSQWGQLETDERPIVLVLRFKRPMELMAVLPFDLNKYGGFVDQVLAAKALYLQAGEEGDRLKDTFDEPRIYLEIPDTGFKPIWDDLFYRNAFAK